ncbi:MAG: hypothetical protein KME64_27715 [Scytonematopsis contorta HA4267-MV1]|jgi:molecular chaperone GrpE (heat shock protein)|nr:hypothetical protein [Scytonematopsis contorta HA4267-MV1]
MSLLVREQLQLLDQGRDQLVEKIFQLEILLNSPGVLAKLQEGADKNTKIKIIESVLDLSLARRRLENALIEKIATQLKRLEPEIQKGIDNLDRAINEMDEANNILNFINILTGIIARVVGLL